MTNTVELIGLYGGDETHALSAWTSTSRDLTDEKKGRIGKLLQTLADNGHGTPFEKSYIHFLVTCDTASHIHIIKHRVGVSVNAESARYKELKEDRYYVPEDWPNDLVGLLEDHANDSYELYRYALTRLTEEGFSRKRAKESARYFLPYSNQLTLDVGFNFRSFIHFLNLRYDDHAQKEIKDIAGEMLALVKFAPDEPFKYSLQAFGY